MTDYNPADVEAAIRQCANQIAEGVRVCGERYAAFLDADRLYDAAYARAYLDTTGPVHERKYGAELVTQDERAARDAADAAYKYADRRARALEAELRALQSVGASIRSMYGVAGRGEGA
ncbi:hypothetical protein IU487_22145 [Nocardia puris]|uniref:Excreted virulence factor EspC (Type VII ESX diderm) n=1 Tax=Nocardia puris TaxID=208602 RepID=A0A366CW86_9NOCA|nr:hypothetical protein [Nocardia puris]MBF6213721.1 hypothetical protein [Nocardia puris]RBO82102.1 hypothetical protein DFR74_12557 [Nocardia puris]